MYPPDNCFYTKTSKNKTGIFFSVQTHDTKQTNKKKKCIFYPFLKKTLNHNNLYK